LLILSLEWCIGTLPCIDYEGIESTLCPSKDDYGAEVDDDRFQAEFEGGFTGAVDLSRALVSGLRGEELIPALLCDFNVWQTCPSDRYGSTHSNLGLKLRAIIL
jgi:hypothetical protein